MIYNTLTTFASADFPTRGQGDTSGLDQVNKIRCHLVVARDGLNDKMHHRFRRQTPDIRPVNLANDAELLPKAVINGKSAYPVTIDCRMRKSCRPLYILGINIPPAGNNQILEPAGNK